MLFNSAAYAVFLPAVLVVYWLTPIRHRLLVILVASYVFYAVWDWRFLTLIWLSTGVDYAVGRSLPRVSLETRRRLLLMASIGVNLGMLGFFKYWGFFVYSAGALIEGIGLQANLPSLRVILPVGISFYTFQTMSYTIDVYRRRLEPETDLRVFAAYVAFFPQLVAGPIERAERLLPQLRGAGKQLSSEDLAEGAWLIFLGLFRKLALADSVAPIVNGFYDDPSGFGVLGAVLGVAAFSIQIYGDFAGYTDIARGSARLLGVRLVENFRRPYLAKSFREFWQSWHISLSTWLRDYLYIPLGGNRGGRLATGRNLMLTMLLGGLWHGAAWTFVFWGFLHGLYLAIERRWLHAGTERRGIGSAVVIFVVVSLTWIPFRAPDLTTALEAMAAFFRLGTQVPGPPMSTVLFVAAAVGVSFVLDVRHADVRGLFTSRPLVGGIVAGGALTAMVVGSGTVTSPFIYFQF